MAEPAIDRTVFDELKATAGDEFVAELVGTLLEEAPVMLAELRAARADIGAARAVFFPTILLTGAYGYASSQLDDLVGSDNRGWTYSGSIDLPIFRFGRGRAEVATAKARERIAIATYQRAVQTA